MKITPELLKRYHLGLCTPTEAKAIEHWLQSDEMDDAIPELEDADELLANTWENISSKIQSEELPGDTVVMPLYKKKMVVRYAAAACLLLAIIAAGVFTSSEIQYHQGRSNASGFLEISSRGSEAVRVTQDSCKINFTGRIQLTNTSYQTKTIVCGSKVAKTFSLLPGETYYLESLNGIPNLIREREITPTEDPSPYLRGHFSVHMKTA